MSRIKWYVFLLMDKSCELTGHDTFLCWNRGEGRIRGLAHRVWIWSNDLLPDEEMSEPRDEAARD